MKPFLRNKSFIGNNDITHIHKNKIISDEKQLTKLLKRPVALNQKPLPQILNTSVQSVRDTVNSYENNPLIIKIEQVVNAMDPMFLIVKDFPSKRSTKVKLKILWKI